MSYKSTQFYANSSNGKRTFYGKTQENANAKLKKYENKKTKKNNQPRTNLRFKIKRSQKANNYQRGVQVAHAKNELRRIRSLKNNRHKGNNLFGNTSYKNPNYETLYNVAKKYAGNNNNSYAHKWMGFNESNSGNLNKMRQYQMKRNEKHASNHNLEYNPNEYNNRTNLLKSEFANSDYMQEKQREYEQSLANERKRLNKYGPRTHAQVQSVEAEYY